MNVNTEETPIETEQSKNTGGGRMLTVPSLKKVRLDLSPLGVGKFNFNFEDDCSDMMADLKNQAKELCGDLYSDLSKHSKNSKLV